MRRAALLLALLVCTGCAGSKIAPVSGTVTLNGKPLPFATVVFEPISSEKDPGPGSTGTTDANGKFTLVVMSTNATGAIVGKHKVSITAYEGDVEGESSAPDSTNKVNRKLLVPQEYNSKSTLTFEVPPEGTTNATFDLKSGKS